MTANTTIHRSSSLSEEELHEILGVAHSSHPSEEPGAFRVEYSGLSGEARHVFCEGGHSLASTLAGLHCTGALFRVYRISSKPS